MKLFMTKRSSAFFLAVAVGLALFLLTLAVWWQHRESEAYLGDLEFAREANRVVHRIREWGQHYETLLQSARTMAETSENVSRPEWERFANRQGLASLYPGVRALTYHPVAGGRASLVLLVRDEGMGKVVAPLSIGSLNYRIKTPDAGQYRLPAIAERARDTALSVMARADDFRLDNLGAGDLFYFSAAYEATMPIGTVEERRSALQGFVGMIIDSRAWFGLAMADVPAHLALRVGDVLEAGAGDETPYYERGTWPAAPARVHDDWLTIGGRVIHVTMAAPPLPRGGALGISRSMWILGGGAAISALVGLVVWLVCMHRCRAMELAAGMTQALRVSEERYRKLFTANRAVELLIEPDSGRIVDANEAAMRFYGWSCEQLRTMRISDINTLQPEQVAEEMRRASKERRDHFYFQHRCADGRVRDVEVHSGPVDVDGREVLYSIVHDITERKRAERRLAASEARFRTLFEQSPLPIQVLMKDGCTLRVNHAWEDLWQRSATEVATARECVFEDPQLVDTGVAERLRQSLSGEAVVVEDFPYTMTGTGDAPAQTRWLNAHAYPSRDENGQLSEVIVVYQDVTERRAQEQALVRAMRKLERSNTELEQFAYVASHDLQEPLRMVSSYMNLLERRYGGQLNDEAREFIGYAVDGAQRMQHLILDLLTYSRVDRLGAAMKPVPAEDSLRVALADLRVAIEETDAKVSHGPLPTVRADEAQLVRLFENLIGNALKYRRPGVAPEIHISAEQQGGEWVFKVRDNGIGIKPEFHERVFRIFQRLHTAAEYPGTGVGLAMCKKIVERHEGRIGLDSHGEGGATFWFTLPVLRRTAATAHDAAEA